MPAAFVFRFWRTLRLGMLAIMFVGLTVFLLVSTPWAKYFGRQPGYGNVIAQGQPIVDAIYRFKAERGLWPEYLDDLYPRYLDKRPDPYWNYVVLPGGPSLAVSPTQNHNRVGFNFDPETPAWRAVEEDAVRTLKAMPLPGPTTLPAEVVARNELEELDRRLVADQGAMIHYRAKASLLRSLHRLEETRAVIGQARAADPNHFWPRLAEAVLDLEGQGATPSSRPAETGGAIPLSCGEFEKWALASPTFTHLYYVALLERLEGRDVEAIAVVRRAAVMAPETSADDMKIPAFYLWDMSRYAGREREDGLVLTLTGSWLKMQSDGRYEEHSCLALAAGAKLALGDFAGAQADMERYNMMKVATWAKNTAALEAAIGRKDRSFRYDPGPTPAAFQAFELAE